MFRVHCSTALLQGPRRERPGREARSGARLRTHSSVHTQPVQPSHTCGHVCSWLSPCDKNKSHVVLLSCVGDFLTCVYAPYASLTMKVRTSMGRRVTERSLDVASKGYLQDERKEERKEKRRRREEKTDRRGQSMEMCARLYIV